MKIREIIVVEGVYDKNTVKQVVDATVVEIGGFGVFNNEKLRDMLRRLAMERGVIILTDSDAAGFVIRNHLRGILPPDKVRHAYIPDIYGKERRKARAGKEGKIGVEGMPPEIILDALRKAGATEAEVAREALTSADYYEMGLSGRRGSAFLRDKLKRSLGLPERLSSKALFSVLEALYSKEEVVSIVGELSAE